MYSRVKKNPSGYCLTIDGKVVEQAGKNGIIKSPHVARSLQGMLQVRLPDSDVALFAFYEMTL